MKTSINIFLTISIIGVLTLVTACLPGIGHELGLCLALAGISLVPVGIFGGMFLAELQDRKEEKK